MPDPEVTKTDQKPEKKRTLLQRIVNVFLYIGVITLAIFIFLFGFSQTQTFRNWLRDFVVEQVNDNLNGKISIEKIEGTIFTSLILRNTVLTMEKDTLLNAGLIELRTSPLKIFLKQIYVRKAEIKDTRIAFISDSTGVLNISRLFPPSEKEDTAKSHFPFRIDVADFKLTNVDFSLQNYDKVGSRELYSSMNMDDFRVDDIFLSLSAFADIDNNTFETKINYLALKPNLNNFNLKSLSGEFGINPDEIIANNLSLHTSNSDINLNAKVNGLNIFDSTLTKDIDYAVYNIDLESRKFNFDDLSAFVQPTDMLKGAVGVELNASGNLIQLNVNKIVLDYEKTHLETKAIIRNLSNIDKMSIAAEFKNSYINEPDVSRLLPEYGIPSFEKLGIVKVDTLTFSGHPLNFNSDIRFSTTNGEIVSSVKMDLKKPITEYEISLETKNLDLSPIANTSSSLNLEGKLNGKGFSPREMNTDILLIADESTIEGIKFDSLSLTAQANAGLLGYSLLSSFNKAKAEVDGSLNFLHENLGYKANGIVQNLDIGKLIHDTAMVTDLNFNFQTEGKDFNIDEMKMFLAFNLSPSMINGVEIDSLRTITNIFTDDNENRVISFISDVADVTVKGKFSFTNLLSVINEESSLITNAFMNKIDEIIPSNKLNEVVASKKFEETIQEKTSNHYDDLSLVYLIDLKDFGIISPFLKDKRLEIDGNLSGNVLYSEDKILLTSKSNLNYVKYWGKTEVYFLSNLNADINLANALDVQSTEDINLDLKAEINRIFTGTDLKDIYLDLKFKDNIAKINFSTSLEDYASAKLKCLANMKSSVVNLEMDTLDLYYKGFDLRNKEKLNLSFSENKIEFNKFRLIHSNGEITANGYLAADQDQKLDLIVKDIAGKDLFQIFSNGNGLGLLDINLNLIGTVTGDYSNPILEFELNGNNLTYKGKNFGDLVSKFKYADKNFSSDIKFFDSYNGFSSPALKLIGNIPINLSLTDTGKTVFANEDIELNLISNNLDLTPFSEVIPGVSKFKGYLNCDVKINGTIQEPYPNGYIKLDNSSFLLKYNNLEYDAGIKITVAKDYFSLDSLLLANSEGTQFGGKITGGGTAELDNLNMTSSQFTFNGNLKVLGEETKFVSPNLYGDLVISTNGNFELKFDKNGANLKAPINVDVANLTYAPTSGVYTSSSDNFIYKFVEDTIKKDSKTMDFEALVNLSKLNETEEIERTAKKSKFDYNIDVTVEDEATLTYVLSREFNQDLIAIVRGNFQYERIGGKPIAQGELELLEGSTLEFIKTLNAEGKIRFESELSNPYLDITAVYKNYYYPEVSTSNGEGDQSGSDEIEVAVKLRIKGSLKELDKNLSQQSDKLTVYYGAKNIEDNIPDPTKDASDAVMFMLLGKFNDNVTQQERNVVSSYAASFAGSIVGGFLNRQLGDYVRSLEIRQSATDTKFILAGRAGKFRYSIGGSTSVFQDLGLANVKIEYPITRSFFMRLERKEALSETKYINDMVNELGLKYRFEF